MKAKDHIRIARTLAKTYSVKGRRKGAFVVGNILPDINVFSYLTLARKNHLRGHSYTYKKRKMDRHMDRPHKNSMLWWLRTGMLCHYLTDSFTGAHDEKRGMSLADHRKYEYRLHDLFEENWKKLRVRLSYDVTTDLSETIERMRREYEADKNSIETDCRMIIEAVRQAMGALTA